MENGKWTMGNHFCKEVGYGFFTTRIVLTGQ